MTPNTIAVTQTDSPVSGSTAASSASPDISARSLCADRCAIPVVCLWSKQRLVLYARCVPWEVVAPLGAARGGLLLLLGHLPIRGLIRRNSPSAIPRPSSRCFATAPRISPRPPAQHEWRRRKKDTRNFPLRSTESSENQGDREGDGPDKIRLERKQRRRRSGQAALLRRLGRIRMKERTTHSDRKRVVVKRSVPGGAIYIITKGILAINMSFVIIIKLTIVSQMILF